MTKSEFRYDMSSLRHHLMGVVSSMFNGSDWQSKEIWLVNDDGLWDLGISLVLFGFSLTMSLGHAIWFVGFVILAYFLVVMAGKEVITRPRMNYFDIQEVKVINLDKVVRLGLLFILLSLGAGALLFIVFESGAPFSWLSHYNPIIIGGILSITFILFGKLTAGGSRYYGYSGLFFSAFLICQILNFPVLPFIYTGAVFLFFSGLCLLVRFFANYPKPDTQGRLEL